MMNGKIEKNTAVFIPIRLDSKRLPSKALLDLNGKPCLARLIDRIKRAKKVNEIVICTTKEKEDEKLIEIAKQNNVKYFQGSTKDILVRYLYAAKKFNISYIVNVDGDDICCDPEFIDRTIIELKTEEIDCVLWKDMPFGSVPFGMKINALKKICELKDTDDTETGWGRFFTETNLFKIKELTDSTCSNKSIRLTLDYPEDLKLFKKIFGSLKEPFSIPELVNFLEKNSELIEINNWMQKKYSENFKNKSTKIKIKKNS